MVPRLISLAAALAVGSLASAQLSVPGAPVSSSISLASEVPQVVLETPDVARFLAEDAARDGGPFRYGAVLATAIGIETHGVWDQTDTHLV